MAYGTPAGRSDVEAYYTHIRRGRPPGAELLANLQARYDAIGGISPLRERSEAQRAALSAALEDLRPGGFTVVLGQKHAPPFIEDATAALVADAGVRHIVGLVLAPHFARTSVGEYHARLRAAAEPGGAAVATIDRWHLEPAYVDLLAGAVREARASMPPRHKVLFTAHSLPERVLDGDPYPDELRASAAAIADRAGLGRWSEWSIAWQSAGATPEPWRGPDVLRVIRDLGATGRADGVVVCPQGFVSDHLEVLYDLDVEAARVAAEAGLAFARTRVMNDDPTVLGALAARVVEAAGVLGRAGT
ncbi:MAG: ferrochelatase [Actinobacteria bacterium]|nr:ferrochelatase [Actinomycetota bacterium]